jgi:hypothetical protein
MKKIITPIFLLGFVVAFAQSQTNFGQITGNFQSDFQYYIEDTLIDPTGQAFPDERLLGTGFLNLTYRRDNFMAGIRYENYQNNRVGLPVGYQGEGITYRYARFIKNSFDVTAGNFYEQFGSGLIMRAYEERGLGLDNNLDGLRMVYTPVEGITLKGLIGRQRNYFEKSNSIVRGFDGEWSLKNTLNWEGYTNLILGAGIVSKFQQFNSAQYVYPNNVAAGAFRANLITERLNFFGEFAYKANDPSLDNAEIFKPGTALYLTGSYTGNNLGASLSIKHYDNFSFRSEPATDPQQLLVGYLPSVTTLHTYALPALYAYNTVMTGEQGYQGEVSYNFKRGTGLGGKYGTKVMASFAQSFSLDKDYTPRDITDDNDSVVDQIIGGTDGYTTNFGIGDFQYFHDFHVQIQKKLSKKWKLSATYYNFFFNNDALRKGVAGALDFELIKTDTDPQTFDVNAAVIELLWKIKPGHSLRTEIQGLLTEGQDGNFGGDWGLILMEYSIAPEWFFAIQDAYNFGNNIEDLRIHYISVNVGYTHETNRFQLGYGRQQEGVFCVGGICRVVPASNGFTFGVTSNF